MGKRWIASRLFFIHNALLLTSCTCNTAHMVCAWRTERTVRNFRTSLQYSRFPSRLNMRFARPWCVYAHACVLRALWAFGAHWPSLEVVSSPAPFGGARLVWKIDIVRCCHDCISQPYLLTWSAGQRTIHMQERVTSLWARELVVIQARMCQLV